MNDFGIIIAAGGASTRFGGTPKLLQPLQGRPVVCHSIATFATAFPDAPIYLVTPEPLTENFRAVLEQNLSDQQRQTIHLVIGGSTRADSVLHGLEALIADAHPAFTAIHDAARPFCPASLLQRCLDALRKTPQLHGAIAAHPCIDTIHTADGEGYLTGTPPRATLWCAETPQVFHTDALLHAYQSVDWHGTPPTDEADLMLRCGLKNILAISNLGNNHKITYASDLTAN